MRALCAVLIVAAFAVRAQAGQPTGQLTGRSSAQPAFAQLKSWSSQGRAITFKDLDGFYSGRCFAAVTPNRAENAMIGYYTRSIGENRGPAFPSPKPETKIATVQAWDLPADYFDDETIFADNRGQLETNMKRNWARTGSIQETPTLNWTIDWENSSKARGRADEAHSLVSYGDYFIETWSAGVDETYGGGWGYHKRGDTLAMCYYFKKLN